MELIGIIFGFLLSIQITEGIIKETIFLAGASDFVGVVQVGISSADYISKGKKVYFWSLLKIHQLYILSSTIQWFYLKY